jgi:tetratricopeptide (TPR) repeat protein
MSEELREFYERGSELFEKGNYVEAEGLLRKIFMQNPGYADVMNKLGVIESMNGNLEEAADFFEGALRLNPSYTEASLNLTITYNEMGRLDEALEVFEQASKKALSKPGSIDPFAAGKLANEHYRLGNLYLDFSLYDEAIEEYKKAVNLRSGLPDVRTKLGVALRESGRHEEAIEELKAAKEANMHYGQAWVQLGLAYYMNGEVALAFKEWEQVLKQYPDLKEARSFLNILRDRM